jgi:flagellar motor component MotA
MFFCALFARLVGIVGCYWLWFLPVIRTIKGKYMREVSKKLLIFAPSYLKVLHGKTPKYVPFSSHYLAFQSHRNSLNVWQLGDFDTFQAERIKDLK